MFKKLVWLITALWLIVVCGLGAYLWGTHFFEVLTNTP